MRIIKLGMLHLWCYDQKSVDEDGEVLAMVWRRETFTESTRFSCAENPIEGKPWALAGRLVAQREEGQMWTEQERASVGGSDTTARKRCQPEI